jgi:hypothetical protein
LSYVSYPFTLDTIGIVKSTDLVSKIYEDRLLTLLSTQVGQRPMRPTYGVDLSRAFFENEYIVDSGNVETDSDEEISLEEKKQRDRAALKERLAREYDESIKEAKEAADAGEGCTMCSS